MRFKYLSILSFGLIFWTACGPSNAQTSEKTDGASIADPAAKRVLFIVTSHDQKGDGGEKTGYYLSEVSHAYKVFLQNGFAIDFASPKGGEPPIDGYDLSDTVNAWFVKDAQAQAAIQNSMTPAAVDTTQYAAVYYAGGHGAMWDLPDNTALARITAQIYESGGVVGAVCHGPAGLVNVKLSNGKYLVAGRKIAAFTNAEEDAVELTAVVPFLLEDRLRERGAKFSKAALWQEHMVRDGRLVTGQNPASAYAVARAMVAALR